MDKSGFTRHEKENTVFYSCERLDGYGVKNALFTRFGGVSEGSFSSLNFSRNRKDENGLCDASKNVDENYRRALSVIGVPPEKCVSPKQVHSARVLEANLRDGGRGITSDLCEYEECDGVIIRRGSGILAAAVKGADCVPVIFYDPLSNSVGALHAGWRGTADGICENMANMITKDKKSLVAVICQAIGGCCYEVSKDVRDRVCLRAGDDACFDEYEKDGEKKYKISLPRANENILVSSGLKRENVIVFPHCTCCFRDENGEYPFFSHRRMGGHSGTCAAFISLP